MSATRAAAALLKHDCDLYQLSLRAPSPYTTQWGEEVQDHLREYVAGTWTLALAADAAGVDEVQVLAALFYQLGTGSTVVARGNAQKLWDSL